MSRYMILLVLAITADMAVNVIWRHPWPWWVLVCWQAAAAGWVVAAWCWRKMAVRNG